MTTEKENSQIVIWQYRSRIGSLETHKKILDALGLKKMNRRKIVNDTPTIRGMINKIPHLVKWEPYEE